MTVIPPCEGLPPCVKVALFDDRLAVLYDRSCKCASLFDLSLPLYCSMSGPLSSQSEAMGHPGTIMPRLRRGTEVIHVDTDDPAEAQAAFERGSEYVRTGVLE